MAASTFRDVWGLVALHVPMAPISLVQNWVQDAYDAIVGQRHWSFLRKDVQLTTLASRAVTTTFTQNSTAITSAAGFVSTDVGRQIRATTTGPIYTIDTVTDTSNAILTLAYAGDSGALSATIKDIYLVMPADFRSFHTVTDMSIQRPIAWWIARDRLDLFDPGRISSDTRFRVLAAASLSQVTTLLGRATYEAWPHPTGAGSYALQYFKRTDTLLDTDTFTGPLATWTSALQQGALASAAMWPGTAQQRNPYFNLQLAKMLNAQFDALVKSLDVMDDDLYLMDLQQTDLSKFGLASLSADTTLMRQSDATAGDYF